MVGCFGGHSMKKTIVVALLLLLAELATAAPFDKKGDNTRTLSGRVLDRQDAPLVNAVVYLTNTRTRSVKTLRVPTAAARAAMVPTDFHRLLPSSTRKFMLSSMGTRATPRL